MKIAAHFFTLCIVHVDLSEPAKDLVPKQVAGQLCYELDYDVIVFFGQTEFKAELGWRTKVSWNPYAFLFTGSIFVSGRRRATVSLCTWFVVLSNSHLRIPATIQFPDD